MSELKKHLNKSIKKSIIRLAIFIVILVLAGVISGYSIYYNKNIREKKITTLKVEKQDLTKEVQDVKSTVKNFDVIKNEASYLKVQNKELQRVVNDLDNEKAFLLQEKIQLTERVKQLESAYGNNDIISGLQQENKDLRVRLDGMALENRRLNQEIFELKESYGSPGSNATDGTNQLNEQIKSLNNKYDLLYKDYKRVLKQTDIPAMEKRTLIKEFKYQTIK